MYLWIQDGEIIGMVHTEEPRDYFIQVAPKYKNYEKEMIKHIMCDVRSKTPERKSIVLTVDKRDIQRIELFESIGGKKLNDVDTLRILNVDEYELIVIFETKDNAIRLEVPVEKETVWLTQAQMIEFFDRDQSVISRHINNAFKEELDKESNMQKMHLARKKITPLEAA